MATVAGLEKGETQLKRRLDDYHIAAAVGIHRAFRLSFPGRGALKRFKCATVQS